LNFFENRLTNAAAESFNAKLKSFRATFRGVDDVKFYLYRVIMLYA
ncbi:MAG: transposase, partial [Bacteroidaceae bacterium]